jgi:hypothetical protein
MLVDGPTGGVMSAEVIKQLVPFGIIGLAIVAILLIVLRPITKNLAANLWLAIAAVVIIGGLAIFDKLTPIFQAAPQAPISGPGPGPKPSGSMLWVDTGIAADWGGSDIASTTGPTPKYKVKDVTLCEEERHVGSIATCWQNRPNGYPRVDATDIAGAPPRWCTYKDSNAVKLSTAPNGYAPPGRVYLCAHSIPPS